MIDREVTQTRKDENGNITALCNPSALWSPKLKSMAILEIEYKTHRYYVRIGNKEVDIRVINDPLKGKYLRTDPDITINNNLNDLPHGEALSKLEEEIGSLQY